MVSRDVQRVPDPATSISSGSSEADPGPQVVASTTTPSASSPSATTSQTSSSISSYVTSASSALSITPTTSGTSPNAFSLSTTLNGIPTGYTLWVKLSSDQTVSAVSAATTSLGATTLPPGITVYMSVASNLATIDAGSAVRSLSYTQSPPPGAADTTVLVFSGRGPSLTPLIATTPLPLSSGDTVLVPVTVALPTIIAVDTLSAQLEAYTSSASSSTAAGIQGAQTGSADANSSSLTPGTFAGGIIGGIIIGLSAGLLIAWCFVRRRKSKAADTVSGSTESDYGNGKRMVSNEKTLGDEDDLAILTSLMKHIPQGKDDAGVRMLMQSLFHNIHMHIECYYSPRDRTIPSQRLQALKTVASQYAVQQLSMSKETVVILKSIATAYILSRISLRCAATKSFLPADYVSIPIHIGWHMEDEERKHAQKAEQRQGFLPALAMWRALSSFVSNGMVEKAFQQDIRIKQDEAFLELTAAMSHWEAQKDNDLRDKSLMSILCQASDTGLELFAHPSTFLFDWSTASSTPVQSIVVSPAVIKVLDESGKKPSAKQTILIANEQEI